MRKAFFALVGLAVAFSAPGASAAASHTGFDCALAGVGQKEVIGGAVAGVAYGYAVSPTPGDSVEVICYVRVDGVPSSPPAPGTSGSDGGYPQADTYASRVTYTAHWTQDVEVCAVVYVNGTLDDSACFLTASTQIPPQEFIDFGDLMQDTVLDLVLAVTGPCITVVDSGTCNRGICVVNTATGTCDGGICVVNSGNCGRGCTSVATAAGCGDSSVTVYRPL